MWGVSNAHAVVAGIPPKTMVRGEEDVWTWMSVCHPEPARVKRPVTTYQALTLVPVTTTTQCAERWLRRVGYALFNHHYAFTSLD